MRSGRESCFARHADVPAGEGDGSGNPDNRALMDIPLFERLQIESQSNCNRACWFCPRTYDRSGKYLDPAGKSVLRQMPTEKILGLLDEAQVLGFSGMVGFHHYSEPLLDPRNIQPRLFDESYGSIGSWFDALADQSTDSRYLEMAYLMAARPQGDRCLDLLVTGDNLHGSGKQLAFIDGCGPGNVSRRSRQ